MLCIKPDVIRSMCAVQDSLFLGKNKGVQHRNMRRKHDFLEQDIREKAQYGPQVFKKAEKVYTMTVSVMEHPVFRKNARK